jgi:hypothetical protein
MSQIKWVYLSELENLKILWPGDFHTLAEFTLKCHEAKDKIANARNTGSVQKSRPSIHGVAMHYSRITDLSGSQIEQQLKSDGFDLGATVDFDQFPNISLSR